jgi:hypothetical protein
VISGETREVLAIAEISHRGYVAHGIRSSADKYIQRFSPEEGELYFDLFKDPGELENRIAQSPARARELKGALERAMTSNPFQNHLRAVGPAEYALRLRTGGWFEKVDTASLGPEDKSDREDNGRKLFLTIHSKPGALREIAFTVRPIGAPVFVEGTRDGKPLLTADIFCGQQGEHPEGIPARLPEVEGFESERHLSNNVLAPPEKPSPGIHLWITSTRPIMFEGNREALCALGYQDCSNPSDAKH